MPKPAHSSATPAYILVVAPQALLPLYAGEHTAAAPVRCVSSAGEALECLNADDVAAVVCHDTLALDGEARRMLAAWYHARRTHAPLLAVVTDLVAPPGGGQELHPYASLHFSSYHSTPGEVISHMRRWAFAEKRKKKPA